LNQQIDQRSIANDKPAMRVIHSISVQEEQEAPRSMILQRSYHLQNFIFY